MTNSNPNSTAAEGRESDRDHRLPKYRILRGHGNFSRLFQKGSVKVLRSYPLNFRLICFPNESDKGCQVGFIVRRKLGKATARNRMKRRMREAYRRQQHLLCQLQEDHRIGIHGAFTAQTLDVDYNEVRRTVRKLLHRAREFILSSSLLN